MGLGRKEWAGVMGVRAGKGFGREDIDRLFPFCCNFLEIHPSQVN